MINTSAFKRIQSGISTRFLSRAIDYDPYIWDEITERQTTPGSPHYDTHTIFVRWCRKMTIEAVFTDLEAIDYPAKKRLPYIDYLINHVMDAVGSTELGRVIITSLKPGGVIAPHVDEGAYADHYERFHLVLKSEFGNRFEVLNNSQHGEFVWMKQDELWWFDHKKEHAAKNMSNEERIHMIVDCVAPKYRTERI